MSTANHRRKRRPGPSASQPGVGSPRGSILLCLLLLSAAASAFVAVPPTRGAAMPLARRACGGNRPPRRGARAPRPAATRSSPSSASSASSPSSSASALPMAAKSGAREITTAESFDTTVLSPDVPRPVLVFFSAPWCGPCRLSNPVVRDVMRQFAGRVDVVEVCTDDLPEVASDAGVASIPTIQVYFGGEVLDTIVGCVAKNVLASAVTKILEDLGRGEDDDLGGE